MDQELLQRYIIGDTTEEERLSVYEWLAVDPEHLKEYQSLKKLHDIYLWNSQVNEEKIKKQSSLRKKWIFSIANAAAIAVILLGIHFFNDDKQQESILQTVYVPTGQCSELTLSDGTQVWLNSNTTFKFPSNFSTSSRIVSLDGEGYFSVTPNKEKPFIVKTNHYKIEVLGTVFNVMAYKDSPLFETTLLSGSVKVSDLAQSHESIILKPHSKVILEENKLHIKPLSPSDTLMWKQNIFSFYDNSFKEITEKLKNYYDINIELVNKKVPNMRYTGKFRTEDGFEHILKVLKLDYPFEYEYIDSLKTVIIK